MHHFTPLYIKKCIENKLFTNYNQLKYSGVRPVTFLVGKKGMARVLVDRGNPGKFFFFLISKSI